MEALQKAERAYNKAWVELIRERDRVFPVGTKVTTMNGLKRTVTSGSLYADQILLDGTSHSGFRHVEKIDEL